MNRLSQQAADAAQAAAIGNLKDKTQGLSYDNNVAGLTGPSGGFLSGRKKALAWDAQGNLVVEGKISVGGADLQTTLDGKQPKGDYVLNPEYTQYKRNMVEALKRFQPRGDYVVKPEFTQLQTEMKGFQSKVDNDMKGLQPKGDYALKGDLTRFAPATELAKFALKSELSNLQTKGDYALKSELANLQAKGDYALKGDLNKYAQATELAKFALKGDLANLQPKGDYALKGDLTGYAPVGELAKFQPKGDYALKGDLGNLQPKGEYALKSDLANLQPKGEYALLSQIPANQDLSKYALVEDLKKYASADELKKYVPVDELKKFASLEELKKYAPVTELRKFASIDELKKYALADELKKFASLDELKKYALAGDLSKYALADELKKYATLDSVKDLSNLKASMDAISKVNLQELASKINAQDLSKYATKEDLKKYRELGFPMDFTLGAGDNSRGDTGPSRALVKDAGGVLAVNYAGDFKGGVRFDSPASFRGNVNVNEGNQINFGWDTDGANIGLKDYGGNRKDLAIVWADDEDDRLRFIHRHHKDGEKELAFMDRNSVNFNHSVNFKGGVSAHNPEKWNTHFPWAGDNKNYIRGDTELRGNLNNIGDIDVGGKLRVGGKEITAGGGGVAGPIFAKPDGFDKPAVQIGANNDVKDTNIYSLSFGKAEGGTYTGMGLVPNDKKAFPNTSGPVLGTHIKAQNEFGIFSDGWDKLFAVQGGSGNVKVKGTLDAAGLTVGGKPIGAAGAAFDGAMNDKQLRLRGAGDGNHYVAYTNNNNIDGTRVQGHQGGQLGTNAGGDRTALQWDKDNNVFVNMSTNPVKFSANWSGFPDDKKNASEISNDTGNYKKLMIVGNKSAGAERRVGVWDRLDVHGNLGVDGTATVAGRNILAELDELKKRPVGSGGAAFDGAMNDKQLRLRGAGDGNHYIGYTGAVDGARVQGHSGGQLGTNKGGDKTALTWNADGDVTVARNAFVGDNVIMSGKNSWILHTPDDGRKQLYIAPGTDGGNWDWGKQTQFMADGSVVIPPTGLRVSDPNDWLRIVGSDKNGVALYNGLSVNDNGGVNVGDWGRVPKGTTRTHKLKLGDKWTLSGVGDAHGNDDWLRVFGNDEKGYMGGIAMNKLWVGTADATIAGRNVIAELDELKKRPAGAGGQSDRVDVKAAGPLQFGQGFNREANAGQISYGMHDGGENGTLNIVGAGKNGQPRMVNVWESLRTTQAIGVGDMPRDWTGANFKRRDGRWSHFDWVGDGRNYIRGDTVVDGRIFANGRTCRNASTGWNDEGGGNSVFLDRHNVECADDEILTKFKLNRNGRGQFQYDYRCCKL